MVTDKSVSLYAGSCLCGSISFAVESFAKPAVHCHCTMCRKFHGAAFGTLVGVNGLTWLRGKNNLKNYTADNGAVRTFCNRCGSSIGFRVKEGADLELAIATFDDAIPVNIEAHIYTNYSANWLNHEAYLPKFGEGLG